MERASAVCCRLTLVAHVQMKALLKELGGSLGMLLSHRRAGVVASLVAAAQRTGACQEAVCTALASALRSNSNSQQVSVRCC